MIQAETILRSKLVHAAIALTALIWIFEFVPTPPGGSEKVGGNSVLYPHLMIIATIRHGLESALSVLPSWMGIWSVYQSSGVFHPLAPDAESIRDEARSVLGFVRSLQTRKFFRTFKVDLTKECPFWARQDLCSSPEGSCHVCECSEEDIPPHWREKPIEHFVSREALEESVTPWVDQRSSRFGDVGAAEDDFLDTLSGAKTASTSYVDLVKNPPGFTAYKGRNVWQLIYKDNCIRNRETEIFDRNDPKYQPSCSDEDVYERILSGLQTTIMVLASEFNAKYVGNGILPLLTVPSKATVVQDMFPDRYAYDLDLYRTRVNTDPRWIDNMYLDFSLLLRTMGRLSPIISNCGCYTGTDADDAETHALLAQLLDYVQTETQSGSPKYTQMPIFTRKQDQAIRQMNNISKIFDCIECEKCRLHGKVKLTALQVAVKSLPASGYQQITSIERNELVALVNALSYFAEAISVNERMKNRVLALRRLNVTAFIWLSVGASYLVSTTWAKLRSQKKAPTAQTPLAESASAPSPALAEQHNAAAAKNTSSSKGGKVR